MFSFFFLDLPLANFSPKEAERSVTEFIDE